MIISQLGAQIFVGVAIAVITAFVNKIIQEKINIWVILGVVILTAVFYELLFSEGNAPHFLLLQHH